MTAVQPVAEILGPADDIEVIASPLPFSPALARTVFRVPAGLSIVEIVERAQPDRIRRPMTRVFIGACAVENHVPPRHWRRIRPKPGTRVYVQTLSGDGGFRQIFIALAVILAAVLVPQSLALTGPAAGLVGGLTAAVVGFGLNFLIPPPKQEIPKISSLQNAPSITGFGNALDPLGVIERPLGEIRITPRFLAEPFREIVGDEQWVRMIFAVRGPVEFDDFRFGRTSVDKLERVRIRATQGWPESPRTFTSADVDTNAHRISIPDHSYARHNTVRFKAGKISGDILPAGLEDKTTYFIVSRTKGSVKVSLERDGRPVKITSGGQGTHTVRRFEPNPGIYPGQVFPEAANLILKKDEPERRFTADDVDEANLVFFFPEGLVKIDPKTGDLDPQTVLARVEFRLKGATEWSNNEVTVFKTRTSRRVRPKPEPVPLPGSARTVTAYPLVMDPATGEIEALDSTAPASAPVLAGENPEGQRAPGAPPFPDNKIPLALVTRSSDDDDKIQMTAIQDFRPTVAGTRFPRGAAFGRDDDFKPTPASPRSDRIRIRKGTLHYVALSVREKTRKQFFRAVSIEFPDRGTYELRVTRINNEGDAEKGEFDEVKLVEIQSIRNDPPISRAARKQGIALVAVRAKASDNLEGVLDQFNFIARSIFPDWNDERKRWVQRFTKNPASILRGILQGPGNPQPIPDSRLNLEDFQCFHKWCVEREFTVGQTVDFATTVLEQARSVAALGRASLSLTDLKYGLVIDQLKSNQVTVFSPHTIIKDSLRVEINHEQAPHGFRAKFRNENKNYRADERVVYRDPFDEETADPAKIESLELPGIVNPKHARRMARYFLAVAEQRKKVYRFEIGLQAFQIRSGDLVGLNHDVAFFGLGSARVTQIVTSGGNVTGVTLSSTVLMEAGESYAVQAVKRDGSIVALDVDTLAVEQASLTLTSPPVIADGPEVDDMVVFGKKGLEVAPVLVKDIVPTSPYRARLTCLDLAPGIFQVDGEPVPDFESFVTLPPELGKPVILGVRSDEQVATIQNGRLQFVIQVSLRPPSGLPIFVTDPNQQKFRLPFAATNLQAQIRVKPEDDPDDNRMPSTWTTLPDLPLNADRVRFPDVSDAETYEIRLRYQSATQDGEWTAVIEHKVVGLSTPPPDVVDLFATLDELNWLYPDVPPDLDGFLVRAHFGNIADWGSAAPLHPQTQPIKTTPFSVTNLRGTGRRTLLVKAVDLGGNESINPATVLFDFGVPAFENVVLRTDYHPTFPGVIVNGQVVSEKLESVSNSDHWPGTANPDEPYWRGNVAYPIWQVQFPRMTYEADFLPSSKASLTVESAVDSPDGHQIEIRKDLPAPIWPANKAQIVWPGTVINPDVIWWDATPGQYFNVPGSLDVEVQPYTIRLTSFASARKTTVSALSAVLDVPDVTERLVDVSIPAAGLRLTLSETFTVITEVKPTLQTGGTAVKIDVIDFDAVNGPLVAGVAGGGGRVPATGDFVVIGYRLNNAAA